MFLHGRVPPRTDLLLCLAATLGRMLNGQSLDVIANRPQRLDDQFAIIVEALAGII